LIEIYAEGGCEIQIHFRAGFADGGVAGDWRAIFNRTEDWLDFVRCETMNPKRDRSGSDKRDVRQTVLVLDGKLIGLSQRIVGKSLASIVQLQPLDNGLCAWINAPKHVVEFFRLSSLCVRRIGRIALNTLGHSPLLVGNGKLEGEVVECVAEVLEAIADDEAEFGNWRRLEEFDPKDILCAVAVAFGPSSVRVSFAPGSQFRLKALQVVDCPV
jgi:hypothetical protein